MKEHACPWCGKVNDEATALADLGAVPTAGDVSVCIGCAGLAVWTDAGITRLPTSEELDQLEADDDVRAVRAAVRASLAIRRYRLN